MKRFCHLILGLAILLAAVRAGAEEQQGHLLATGKLPPAGIVLTRTLTSEFVNIPLSFTMGDHTVAATLNQNKVTITTETILAADRFTSEITCSKTSSETVVNSTRTPNPQKPNPLENVTILVSRADGHWNSALENGDPLSEEQLDELGRDSFDKSSASEQLILGKTPRKPGDKWQVDASTLPSFGEMEKMKGTLSCEFVEAKEVDSMASAVIKIIFDVTGVSAKDKDDASKRQIHLIGEMLSTRSLEYEIDLDSRMKAVIDMTGTTPKGVEVRMTGPFLLTGTTSIKKP